MRRSHPTPTLVDTSASPHARLRPVSGARVRLAGGFWADRVAANRAVTIPTAYRRCVETGALANFARAAGRSEGPFRGRYYSDSDVYKWVEAASWALADGDDRALADDLDEVVGLITDAQGADGYLNTYFSVDRVAERWSDLPAKHEMYCLGHLVQAAVAHHRVTGSTRLLDVAVRAAALVERRYPPGERYGACGHPGLEMALVELSRTTGDRRWLELAAWQLDSRGRGILGGSPYVQDAVPVRELPGMVGHAVRMLYLASAVADLALESDDPAWEELAERWWDDLVKGKRSVTGGAGARWDGESFGAAYELPDRAYNESCAAIAVIMFAWRMLLRTGRGEFRDAIEHTLYNAMLPGLSADATRFFYQNPLADDGSHRRQPWFECACCPPNIARTLAGLPGMVATTDERGIAIQLLLGATVRADLGGHEVTLQCASTLPYQGSWSARVSCAGPTSFTLRVPAPAWSPHPVVHVGGHRVDPPVRDGYLILDRTWTPGEEVRVAYDVSPRLVAAHPRVLSCHGQAALMAGPLVYCIEAADVPDGVDVRDLAVPLATAWERCTVPGLAASGLSASVLSRTPADERLYGPPRPAAAGSAVRVRAIPYFAWANRAPGSMRVWLSVAAGAAARTAT